MTERVKLIMAAADGVLVETKVTGLLAALEIKPGSEEALEAANELGKYREAHEGE